MPALSRRALLGVGAAAAVAPAVARTVSRSAFLWGAATAAHQIEGNNTNSDYWLLENIRNTGYPERSGDACDSLHRWREDIALVRDMGLNCYRFSIEWARIEPEPGRFSSAMLEHYRRMAAACREAGIEPVVTFHHFTSPRWIGASGGWENPATADAFARYCGVAMKALAGIVSWACTINEPNAQVNSYVVAKGKPFPREAEIRAEAARVTGSDRFGAFFMGDSFKVRDTSLVAHARGRDAIKSAAPATKVGITLALQEMIAGPGGEALYGRLFDEARAPFYAAANRDDFIGVQSYNKMSTGPETWLSTPEGAAERDAWNRDADPGVLGAVIREVRAHCAAPVLVSEHGINTTDDAQRIRHLEASLEGLDAVRAEGIPVLGYIHWSLLDNFEWGSGYKPRFGLVAVDRTTFVRAPKPSAAAYRRLVAQRGGGRS